MEFDGGGGEADHPRLDFGGGAGHRNLMSVLTMWLSHIPTPYKHYIYILLSFCFILVEGVHWGMEDSPVYCGR